MKWKLNIDILTRYAQLKNKLVKQKTEYRYCPPNKKEISKYTRYIIIKGLGDMENRFSSSNIHFNIMY